VEAITSILGMSPCEGSDAVPPNARSHTLLLAGDLLGDAQVPTPPPSFLTRELTVPTLTWPVNDVILPSSS